MSMSRQTGTRPLPGASGPLAMVLGILIALCAGSSCDLQAQTYTVIHNFSNQGDGRWPGTGLTIDPAGNLYGTSTNGGAGGYGTVFKLTHRGSGWILTTLYSFTETEDGGLPSGKVIFGPEGLLYGATEFGGITGCGLGNGCGVVFSLTPNPTVCKTTSCPWHETVLHRFSGAPDGDEPGQVVFDGAGNMYFETAEGGAFSEGSVVELSPTGGGWAEQVVHSFGPAPDGAFPADSPLIFDTTGKLYGTTAYGGAYAWGAIFRLTPSRGGWSEETLWSFQPGGPGQYVPTAGLIFDSSGNLYGATKGKGSDAENGAAFELPSSGGGLTQLYAFPGNSNQQGFGPLGSLVMDEAGNLYGTTFSDGPYNAGTVFELAHSGDTWTYISLHDFTGGSDGGYPDSDLVFDAEGNMYGTAFGGGSPTCESGCGVVFEISLQ